MPERTLLWMVIALAAVLRLVHLGHQSLWVDEMMTLTVATPKPGYPLWQLLRHNIHGPLHTFVVAMFRLVSENDAWLRLPSALAGIASVPLLFAWMRPRLGGRAALWGALLLAVNPLHIHYSQELRNYAFAVFFVLLGSVQLDRLLAGWSRPRAAGMAACVAAAVLSNFSATFTFAAQTVAWFARAGLSRRSLARWAGVVAVVVVLVSPWIYRVTTFVDFNRLATPVLPGDLDASQRLRGDTTVRAEAIPYALYCYSVGFTLGPSLRELHEDASLAAILRRHALPVAWSALLFAALTLAGLAAAGRGAARGRWSPRGELLLYVLLPLVATLALNWQNAKAFNVRYVLVGLPMYLALVAAGIAGLRPARWMPAAAGIAVLATSAVSLRNHYTNPDYVREDVRAATRAVEARLAPGECIFAPTVWQIVNHYRRTDAPVHYVYRNPPTMMERQLAQLDDECDGLWYVRARPWVDDADGAVMAALESRYRRGESIEFPGVVAIHFTRRK